MLQAGIVGLPNVGKSTLFNALTKSHKAQAENYPFCTIDPNIGVVEVPDDRLRLLQPIAKTQRIVPACIEFVDIAGLVAGASRGEGLGNKFLANIREVDAIVHVVRCFENSDIIHSAGSVDPVRDIEIINTELILADLESIESQINKTQKKARANDKDAVQNIVLLEKLKQHLNNGIAAYTLDLSSEESEIIKQFNLLTTKPVIFACNVTESELVNGNEYTKKVEDYISTIPHTNMCLICAQLEADLIEFSHEEARNYLSELGITDSGITSLIRKSYELLGLASYFTAGEMEVRAWTFKKGMKAPQCAGVIHGDFEKGFIKAEVVSCEDLLAAGSYQKAREAGKYRLEGKDYEFKDGDVAIFRFNT